MERPMLPGSGRRPARELGLMYLWMLFLLFLLGLGLGKSLEVYSAALQRERAVDRAEVRRLYDEAVRAYYENSPGYVKTYPAYVNDLLLDPRHLATYRYLRRPLPDPVTGEPPYPVLGAGGRIRWKYEDAERVVID